MFLRCWLILALLLIAAPASAQVILVAHDNASPPFEADAAACPDSPAGGLVGYLGERRVCADVLIGDLRAAPGVIEGAVDEVILLTSRPGTRTDYRAGEDRVPVLQLERLGRPVARPLVLRGQRGADGSHLTWFRGLDLIDTVCDPRRVIDAEKCRAGLPNEIEESDKGVKWARRYEMTSIALVEDARAARAGTATNQEHPGVTSEHPRAYCIQLRLVQGIVMEDLAFEDCWIAAIGAVNAQRVTLRRARIHGSTFGMLAIGTEGLPALSHSFVIADSHWIQSPGAYRADDTPCEKPHLDLSCALDVWDDIPWGVSHHHLWRPLNGALFAARDIAGNVLIENNVLERAYNGVRIISEAPGTGRNVEVRGNIFRFLRDNAVEPEDQAYGWVVKHNRFENVHAWISTDGVAGDGLYVFGNTATYDPDRMPGSDCSDDTPWDLSPRLMAMAGDRGRYELIDVAYDPTSVECRGHYRGTILKTGDDRKSKFPYLDQIAIFHNSWQTRSPIFSSKHASPLSHFNNLIAFTGCGLEGPWDCRQIPVPEQYCQPGNKRTRGRVAVSQYWTDDGGALVADCASLVPGPAQPDERAAVVRDVAHLFCRDLVNRSFSGLPYGEGGCAPIFDAAAMTDAVRSVPVLVGARAGCAIAIAGPSVTPDCTEDGAPIGARRRDGSLFDIDIPGAGYLGEAFRP